MSDPFVPDRDQIETEAGIATADAIQLLWLLTNQTAASLDADRANGTIARYYEHLITALDEKSGIGDLDRPSGHGMTGHGLALESAAGERWLLTPGADAYDAYLKLGLANVGSFDFEAALAIYYNSGANRFELCPNGDAQNGATHYLGAPGSSRLRWDQVHATQYFDQGRTVAMGEWQSYTPTWSSTAVTQPSLGSGTLTGRYTVIGKTVHVRVQLVAAADTTFGGAGVWIFTLPLTSAAISGTANPIGSSFSFDANVAAFFPGSVRHRTTADFMVVTSTGQLGPSIPFTWATGDQFGVEATYELP